jgi:ABC-2 type transport system ATP-binding protein
MKQRLCLAKTLVHDPPVLILDEPASGLDPRARIEVKALLKELRSMGKTILISSHILTELADCCTSIGIMERGQLLAHGPIASVYKQVRRNRVIDIHFLSNIDLGITILRSSPQLTSLDINDNRVTAELQMRDDQVAELLRRFVSNDVQVLSFHDREPTLEDVFMAVTEGLVT